jgi:hypothetical protein
MRLRAASASLASTLPSRSTSHFRINSSRAVGGDWATTGVDSSVITPHQASSRPRTRHPGLERVTDPD